MLQRIQTIYLFLGTISSVAYGYFMYHNNLNLALGLFGAGLLTFINIFLFKNRKLQISINRVICLALIALLGFSIYASGFLSGEKQFSEKDIKLLAPVISIVFLLIANKYIKRDERLVKSVDRIR